MEADTTAEVRHNLINFGTRDIHFEGLQNVKYLSGVQIPVAVPVKGEEDVPERLFTVECLLAENTELNELYESNFPRLLRV